MNNALSETIISHEAAERVKKYRFLASHVRNNAPSIKPFITDILQDMESPHDSVKNAAWTLLKMLSRTAKETGVDNKSLRFVVDKYLIKSKNLAENHRALLLLDAMPPYRAKLFKEYVMAFQPSPPSRIEESNLFKAVDKLANGICDRLMDQSLKQRLRHKAVRPQDLLGKRKVRSSLAQLTP